MSTCISRDGEYGEHIYDGETLGSEFNCARCFAFDEEAADAEVKRLRAALAAAQERERATVGAAYRARRNGAEITPDELLVIWGRDPDRAALAGEGAGDQPQPGTTPTG